MFLKRKKDDTEQKLAELRRALDSLPSLGDPAKVFTVVLTEPEINAIHAALGYCRSNCLQFTTLEPSILKWWNHYGPTLEGLSDRLALLDD